MDVKLEVDLRTRLYQPARSLRKDIAFLADGVFIQEDSLLAHCERAVGGVELAAVEGSVSRFDDGRSNMVNNRESPGRNDLDTFKVTILRQMRVDRQVRPLIGRFG